VSQPKKRASAPFRKPTAAPPAAPPPVDLDRVNLDPVRAAAAALLRAEEYYSRWVEAYGGQVELSTVAPLHDIGLAALDVEEELSRIGMGPDPPARTVRGPRGGIVRAVHALLEHLLELRGGNPERWGTAWPGPLPPGPHPLPDFARPLARLRVVVAGLQGPPPPPPQGKRVKGQPGRPPYSLKALRYALQLKKKGMRVQEILGACKKKFPADDLPPEVDAFRSWLNRKRKRN
jgi:hypothetical protein